jgi:uncharacterized protein (TIGR03437 family)
MHAAITTRGVLLGTWNLEILYANGKPATTVRLNDPLEGHVNVYRGRQGEGWYEDIPRYRSIEVGGIFPGIGVSYRSTAAGELVMELRLAAGVSTHRALFNGRVPASLSNGSVRLTFGRGFLRTAALFIDPPRAFQGAGAERVSRKVRWIADNTHFGLEVDDADPAQPLEIEAVLPRAWEGGRSAAPAYTSDAAGNHYWAAEEPQSATSQVACGGSFNRPIPCQDLAVYKYGPDGKLLFASFLNGRSNESGRFIGLTGTGAVMIAGQTASDDFPTSARAFQTTFGGGAGRDYFAARLDATTGKLIASTYLGGPDSDAFGGAGLAPNGNLHLFQRVPGFSMPVSPQALKRVCETGLDQRCMNGYAAALDPNLERLVYGTYLPGQTASATLHTDGSLYFGGWGAGTDLVMTPGAFQTTGGWAFLARLDGDGRRYAFATYLPMTPDVLAVAPDGRAWFYSQRDRRIGQISANGSRMLADRPASHIIELAANGPDGVHAIVEDTVEPSADAPLRYRCLPRAYLRLGSRGEPLFASYLGDWLRLGGFSSRGNPLLWSEVNSFELTSDATEHTYLGCVVDAPSLTIASRFSPGAIVTLFGQRLGPAAGVSFAGEGGRVPTILGGTSVRVNGETAPLLYASDRQVNFIVPYTVQNPALITVAGAGGQSSQTRVEVLPNMLTLFALGAGPVYPAAALNEDGTLNSTQNPARKGSRVVLFGTGAGQTLPPSVAGEIVPLELRPAMEERIAVAVNGVFAVTEYAGAAPGQVAGLTQLNIRLPERFPDLEGAFAGRARITTLPTAEPFVTIAVK